MSEVPAGWDCHVHIFDAAAPVRGGHYRPVTRPLEAIEAEAARHGVGHLVLVQPSVYGSDNTLLLQALARTPGRHRGVVVLAGDESDATLEAMHAAGVRGARLNRVSPVGEGAGLAARFAALAPRLAARGWHLQWYAPKSELPTVAALHAKSPVPAVLDHLAGLEAGTADDDPAWTALAALAHQGAWVKLSGWYRLGVDPPYASLAPQVLRLASLFGHRLVWGSDWPHTAFAPDALPAYAALWQPVVEALGRAQAQALRERVPAVYR
ncbi:MAG: amidohydrolase family protein [Rubrivivax sp.]|nr:amidohydrolase family protein [Rubrivivax sp.]